MKTYKPNEIKNIALVGSAGSGKTTLAEAMMYEGVPQDWYEEKEQFRFAVQKVV